MRVNKANYDDPPGSETGCQAKEKGGFWGKILDLKEIGMRGSGEAG